MIYKLTFLSEEADSFRRVFEADSEATFLDLHKAILASVNYPDDQMTSFFMCNDRWEKEQEVTLAPMAKSPASCALALIVAIMAATKIIISVLRIGQTLVNVLVQTTSPPI